MESVELPGIGEIKVRRGVNIRYLRIRMAPGRGIWVCVPYGVSRSTMMDFLEQNRNWILENRRDMEVYEEDTGVGLHIGAEIRTREHLLKVERTEGNRMSCRVEGKTVRILVPQEVQFVRVEEVVRKILVELYTCESRSFLPQRLDFLARKFGFSYGRVSFRNNISNWGSCSFENNISLNIKLMKLPDDIIDYVLLHELCHTVEKNHSPAFWELVGKVCPDYAALRTRLRKYNTRI